MTYRAGTFRTRWDATDNVVSALLLLYILCLRKAQSTRIIVGRRKMFSFFYGIVSKQMFILVIRKQLRPLDLGKVIVSRYDDYG
jgi:hypothetical protein